MSRISIALLRGRISRGHALLSAEHRDALSKVFPADEFDVPPPEVLLEESRRPERGHFNIIHHASGLEADVYLVGSDELHAWALQNARRYSLGGLEVRVAPPEYVITRKLEFYREGGSTKHLRDLRSMLAVSSELIELSTLEDWVRRRGPEPEWSEVREPSRGQAHRARSVDGFLGRTRLEFQDTTR